MTTAATTTPLIVETPRGPSIAGTRITVYSVMDYLKVHWSRNFITQIMQITDEQLEAVIEYVAQHREEVEHNYERILRREAEARAHYDQVYRERSPFPPEMPREERVALMRQRIAEMKEAAQEHNGDNPR